jgi:hypothetical protein
MTRIWGQVNKSYHLINEVIAIKLVREDEPVRYDRTVQPVSTLVLVYPRMDMIRLGRCQYTNLGLKISMETVKMRQEFNRSIGLSPYRLHPLDKLYPP